MERCFLFYYSHSSSSYHYYYYLLLLLIIIIIIIIIITIINYYYDRYQAESPLAFTIMSAILMSKLVYSAPSSHHHTLFSPHGLLITGAIFTHHQLLIKVIQDSQTSSEISVQIQCYLVPTSIESLRIGFIHQGQAQSNLAHQQGVWACFGHLNPQKNLDTPKILRVIS